MKLLTGRTTYVIYASIVSCCLLFRTIPAEPALCPVDTGEDSTADNYTSVCPTEPAPSTELDPVSEVRCVYQRCRCSHDDPRMQCLPFNTTLASYQGSVQIVRSITVACVCAIPEE